MSLIKNISFLLLPVMLAGCSYISSPSSLIQNRDKAYLKAKSIPPLRIPPGIGSSAFQNSYPVSSRQYAPVETSISTIPPGLSDK
jgi:uncharacterized lipoprotein